MGGTAAAVLNRLIQNASRTKRTTRAANLKSLAALVAAGDLYAAISLLPSIISPLPSLIYARLIRLCASHEALPQARRVESHLISTHPSPPTFLLNRVIEAYSICGSLRDARELFDEMPRRDGGTWNAIISAYYHAGLAEESLALFVRMKKRGEACPNDISFACALGSCADLLALFPAKQIHGLVRKSGFAANVILGTSLVDIYGKCWFMDDARRAFDEIVHPNEVSWNVIVRRYLDVGRSEDSICMFFEMIRRGVKPLTFTVSNALLACANVAAIAEGRQIHGMATKVSLEHDQIIENSIIEVYVKSGDLEAACFLFDQSVSKNVFSWTSMVSGYATQGRISEAEKLFNSMPNRNVVSWNAMLAGYARFYQWEEALKFIFWMSRETREIDDVTLKLILNVCAGLSDLEMGKRIHCLVYRHGFFTNLSVSNALVDMYGKCGHLRNAECVFLKAIYERDTVSWNALISSFACRGRSEDALDAFSVMRWETAPNEFTFSSVLAACANIFRVDEGKQIHGFMIRNGFVLDVITRGALVDMYSKCRLIDYAVAVFEQEFTRDIVLWNSIILGCAHNGRGKYVLDLFEALQTDGVKADHVTLVGVLLACIVEGYVDLGLRYFDLMSVDYNITPRIEHYECMIELLGKYGFMVELEDFIKNMPFEPNIPMWTRIFDCCREHGNAKLGMRAERCINDSNPITPVHFEATSGTNSEVS